MEQAEFYWHEGSFEGLETCAEMYFEMYQDAKQGEDSHLKDLRRVYNHLQDAQRIADFEEEISEETLVLLYETEAA